VDGDGQQCAVTPVGHATSRLPLTTLSTVAEFEGDPVVERTWLGSEKARRAGKDIRPPPAPTALGAESKCRDKWAVPGLKAARSWTAPSDGCSKGRCGKGGSKTAVSDLETIGVCQPRSYL
jgi:hypothetical protein